MSGWRHVEEWRDRTGRIVQCDAPVGALRVCGCTTPTPDPASPCGYINCEEQAGPDAHEPCYLGDCPHEGRLWCHPHQPTRCTCGHPVERSE